MKRPILAVMLAAFTAGALAQEYPSRPIRFLVTYPPGGSADLMARQVGNALSQRSGQPVIVENRAGGASGVIGAAAVASAAPDGYTLLVTDGTPITTAYLLNKIPYDPSKDLAPLVKGVTISNGVLVAGSAPFGTLKEVLDYARANPGKASWGTPGNGTNQHIGFELLKEKLGLNIVHVPYKSGGPLTVALVGQQITVGGAGLAPVMSHVKSGKLRLLAVWGSNRVGLFPDVPTVPEATGDASLAGLETWFGFLLPAGVPKAIAARIEADIIASLGDAEVTRRLTAAGTTVVAQPAAAFGEAIRAQTATIAAVFRKLNIKAD